MGSLRFFTTPPPLPLPSSLHIRTTTPTISLSSSPNAAVTNDASSYSSFDAPIMPFTISADQVQQEEHIERAVLRKSKRLDEISTWGIGGPCRHFLPLSRLSQLPSAIRYCQSRSMEFVIVGKGSNCLFSDRGFDGLVMLNRIDDFEALSPTVFRVGSGYAFNRLGTRCSGEGFSGLEFAGGIPGTVGGAVFMNAGAAGQETGDVISSVEIVSTNGELSVLSRNQMEFGYRWSSFQEMEDLAAIVAVTFELTPETTAKERQKAKGNPACWKAKCGGLYLGTLPGLGKSAGELIELAGLKGFELRGAKVSDVHANFFINFKGSTSSEMLALINFVKESVYRLFGVELKEEVTYVPYRKLII